MMHENSLFAYAELKASAQLGSRQIGVLRWFESHGPATDRQCRDGLGKADMNSVRPRITELIRMGYMEELGAVEDGETHRMVRKTRAT